MAKSNKASLSATKGMGEKGLTAHFFHDRNQTTTLEINQISPLIDYISPYNY